MKNVEDLYPLSPMQRMMLLHELAKPGSDVLFNQFCYEIRGSLDENAFERAWSWLVARHPALRTSFVWQDLPEPLQAVRKHVELPFERHDWRAMPDDERARRLAKLRADDRRRAFGPERAPLMRVGLVRTADDAWTLVWSSHHLVIDRWSLPIVFEDLAQAYEAERRGELPRRANRVRFRDYIGWLRSRDAGATRRHWQGVLAGVRRRARLVRPDAGAPAAMSTAVLEADRTGALRAFARGRGVTLGTLFQAAWALVLARRTGCGDVVFGVTVSGRPTELDGVESIVGSFVNNVPVRTRVARDRTVGAWLTALQRQQFERAPFEHVSIGEVRELIDLDGEHDGAGALFDSLFVWLADTVAPSLHGVELIPLEGGVRTGFPLTVTVEDRGERFELGLHRAANHAVDGGPEGLLDELVAAAAEIETGADRPVVDLAGSVRVEASTPAPRAAAIAPVQVAGVEESGREREERDLLEQTLATEYAAVLGVDAVDPQVGFFEAGGDSLLAVRLHARIEAVTGRRVPLLSLFADATVAGMARTLARRAWPLQADVVRALQPRGHRPPLFCVASAEVNALGYVLLARHLDPDVPVWLVQEPPSTEVVLRLRPSKIAEVGARYAEAVRVAWPEGPVRLLGMCGGAHLALEIARLLRAEERRVEYVGLINTFALYTLSRWYYLERIASRLRWYRTRIGSALRRKPVPIVAELTPAENGASSKPVLAIEERFRLLAEVNREWLRVDWPRLAQRREKYAGAVTVLRTRKQDWFRIRDERLGWGDQAECVDVEYLPTEDHDDILREPYVRDAAALVAARLANLDREGAP